MRFVLASANAHKAEEIVAQLPSAIELTLQSAFNIDSAEETGLTFVENALLKARHAARETGLPAIADDSGICVDALGGKPGIYSARYSGLGATDEENVSKLLSALGDEKTRSARFHCLLVCLRSAEDPSPLIAEGIWAGKISRSPSGGGGFGYDPVFYLPHLKKTAAQLSFTEKNQISHRGQALRSLTQQLRERYST
jgi:XTP/dITP diphosphohydrolase